MRFILRIGALLVFTFHFPLSDGAKVSGFVQLSLTLSRYSQPNARDFNDNVCDYLSGCDLAFWICLDSLGAGNSLNCASQPSVTGLVANDSLSYTFSKGKRLGNLSNPVTHTYPNGWSGTYLKARSVDIDRRGAVDGDLIDRFSLLITGLTPGAGPTSFPSIKGNRPNNPGTLAVSVQLSCPLGLSGSNCVAAPTTTTQAPVQPTLISLIKGESLIYLKGKADGTDDRTQLQDNIVAIIKRTFAGNVIVEASLLYGTSKADSSVTVTQVTFSARLNSVLLTTDEVSRAFARFSRDTLATELGYKLSIKAPLILLAPTAVDMSQPSWAAANWYYLLAAGLVILLLIILIIGLCICLLRLRSVRRRLILYTKKLEAEAQSRHRHPKRLASDEGRRVRLEDRTAEREDLYAPHYAHYSPEPPPAMAARESPPRRSKVLSYDAAPTMHASSPRYGPNGDLSSAAEHY